VTRGDAAPAPSGPPERRHRRLARRLGLLLGIVAAYVLLAKAGLAFASITPGVSPISPASGLALAAVILWGRRVWPAIFAGAWLATLATAGAAPALAIAGGTTLEALLTGRLLARWSGGAGTFADAGGVVRFAAICLLSGPVVGA